VARPSVSDDVSFVVTALKDPRGPRALTVALIGVFLIYQGSTDFSHDLSPPAVILGGLLLLPLAAFLVLNRRDASILRSLAGQASTTEGQVTTLKKSWLTGAYVLRYRFRDSAGRERYRRQALDQRTAFMWRVGDRGSVRFDPHNPSRSVWIGRGVEFEEDGAVAVVVGTVIDVTHEQREGRKTVRVRYRYRDQVGGTHEGEFHDNPDGGYRTGDTGEVEFAPRHPLLSIWRGRPRTGSVVGETAQAATSSPRPVLAAASATTRPSGLTLVRRSKYLKRAILHGIYVLIGLSFALLAGVVGGEEMSEVPLVAVVGFILFVGFFLFRFLWNARAGAREVAQWRRLMRVGVPVHGTVTLIEEQVLRSRFWTWTYGWEISYGYTDPRGRPQTGESGYLSGRDVEPWRIGDACVILCDAASPDKSVWIA